MTKEEITLWQKIEAFRLDEPEAGFQFSARLARENGWSHGYTLRVIEEYKKFLFMCCISPTRVTPSDPVDQAWHLHLTFTRSYWVDLCRDTIGKEIHHNPTKGGPQEAKKFDQFYTSSQRLYTDKFGTAPPEDIWHNNQQRFSDIDFQRVNLKRNWVIKKPRVSVATVTLVMLFISGTTFIQASDGYWGALIIFGVIVAIGIDYHKRQSDPNRGDRNNGGCSTAGCGGDFGSSHHGGHDGGHGGDGGHSGCGSGCSGCSGGGCSGCGGGGD